MPRDSERILNYVSNISEECSTSEGSMSYENHDPFEEHVPSYPVIVFPLTCCSMYKYDLVFYLIIGTQRSL